MFIFYEIQVKKKSKLWTINIINKLRLEVGDLERI